MNQISKLLKLTFHALGQFLMECDKLLIALVTKSPSNTVHTLEIIVGAVLIFRLYKWIDKKTHKIVKSFPEVDKLKVVKTTKVPIWKANANTSVTLILLLLFVAGVLGATFM